MTDVTRILSAIEQGDPQAAEQLLPLVYEELRKLAAVKLARKSPGKRSRPLPWSMRRTCDWRVSTRRNTGTAGDIFLPPLPKPCGGFWWRPRVGKAP